MEKFSMLLAFVRETTDDLDSSPKIPVMLPFETSFVVKKLLNK